MKDEGESRPTEVCFQAVKEELLRTEEPPFPGHFITEIKNVLIFQHNTDFFVLPKEGCERNLFGKKINKSFMINPRV